MEITISAGRRPGVLPAWKTISRPPVGRGLLRAAAILVFLGGSVPVAAQDTPPVADEEFIAPVDVDTLGLPGPRQPIFYRHDIHAGQYRMECRYCHFAAEVSAEPGLPTISTCIGCHQLIGSGNPEVEKLRAAALEETPPEWIRIHNLPGHVRFPHMMHVNSTDPEITCQECHGEIQRMPQVYQWASLKMGWCIDCHLENEVTTDCTRCHY